MFLMTLGIRGTFRFADYKSGGRRGSDKDSHFGCIIDLLFTLRWGQKYPRHVQP